MTEPSTQESAPVLRRAQEEQPKPIASVAALTDEVKAQEQKVGALSADFAALQQQAAQLRELAPEAAVELDPGLLSSGQSLEAAKAKLAQLTAQLRVLLDEEKEKKLAKEKEAAAEAKKPESKPGQGEEKPSSAVGGGALALTTVAAFGVAASLKPQFSRGVARPLGHYFLLSDRPSPGRTNSLPLDEATPEQERPLTPAKLRLLMAGLLSTPATPQVAVHVASAPRIASAPRVV